MSHVTKIISARFTVATPMFCRGADESGAELRAQSFKGTLRWWWRALAWPRIGDLGEIRDQEDRLFGSSRTGQSRLLIRVSGEPTEIPSSTVLLDGNGVVVGAGARYLGYGVMEAFASHTKRTSAGQLTRACLAAPFEFEVSMRLRSTKQQGRPIDEDLLVDALVAVGLMGGMGAKSRKGYGSLALRTLEGLRPEWSAPENLAGLCNHIDALLARVSTGKVTVANLPPYTAVSSHSRVVVLDAQTSDPLVALDRIGRELVRYRSWGRDGKILDGVDSERNFSEDHDLMRQRSGPYQYPRRVAFGLPHNYSKEFNVSPADHELDRRASPLMFHMHPLRDTTAVVATFLPAEFLPRGKNRLNVSGSRVDLESPDTLYAPVHEFLDRLLDKGKLAGNNRTTRKEPFGATKEVTPK